jgi:hypothetical protein
MSIKKTLALTGMLIILGAGLALAQSQTKASESNMVQSRVENQVRTQSQSQTRTATQTRTMFFDQNGDGICDAIRDHDNDGVPNCQDPDWQPPKDGTGYKTPAGPVVTKNQFGNSAALRGARPFGNTSFRRGLAGLGTGVCDGTGPKGKITRRGRG